MAIQSDEQFEAVINHVISRVEKPLFGTSLPVLEGAIRDLRHIYKEARTPGKLKPMRTLLRNVTDVLNKQFPDDAVLYDLLLDLDDYMDLRA